MTTGRQKSPIIGACEVSLFHCRKPKIALTAAFTPDYKSTSKRHFWYVFTSLTNLNRWTWRNSSVVALNLICEDRFICSFALLLWCETFQLISYKSFCLSSLIATSITAASLFVFTPNLYPGPYEDNSLCSKNQKRLLQKSGIKVFSTAFVFKCFFGISGHCQI